MHTIVTFLHSYIYSHFLHIRVTILINYYILLKNIMVVKSTHNHSSMSNLQ